MRLLMREELQRRQTLERPKRPVDYKYSKQNNCFCFCYLRLHTSLEDNACLSLFVAEGPGATETWPTKSIRHWRPGVRPLAALGRRESGVEETQHVLSDTA